MTRTTALIAIACVLTTLPANAQNRGRAPGIDRTTWSRVQQSTADIRPRSVTLKSAIGAELGLIWSTTVVPGGTLLTVRHAMTPDVTSYLNYTFDGVFGNSAVISQRGGLKTPETTSARGDGSFNRTLYVERASDGAFHFATDDMKGVAKLKLERDQREPAHYLVTLIR